MAPSSEDPKLISRVIAFELVQPSNVYAYGTSALQTDGQTDGRLTIAIPRFALRASLGNKFGSRCVYEPRELATSIGNSSNDRQPEMASETGNTYISETARD